MSESSQSLHFWTATADQIRTWSSSLPLLTRFVASNARWACALTYDAEDVEALALSSTGLVLAWMYDEDCVLELRLYRDKLAVGSLLFRWQGFGDRGAADLQAAVTAALRDAGVLNTSEQEELEDIARAVTAGEFRGRAVRDRVAMLLGLAAYKWLSSAVCFEQPLQEFRQNFPEADDLFE
jgi:hypothetical protein